MHKDTTKYGMQHSKYSEKLIYHQRIKCFASLTFFSETNGEMQFWWNTASACFIGTVCEVVYRQLEPSPCTFQTSQPTLLQVIYFYVVCFIHMLLKLICCSVYFCSFFIQCCDTFLANPNPNPDLVLFIDRNHRLKGPTCKIKLHLMEGKRIANTVNVWSEIPLDLTFPSFLTLS